MVAYDGISANVGIRSDSGRRGDDCGGVNSGRVDGRCIEEFDSFGEG